MTIKVLREFGLLVCATICFASEYPTRGTAECVGVVGRNGEPPACLLAAVCLPQVVCIPIGAISSHGITGGGTKSKAAHQSITLGHLTVTIYTVLGRLFCGSVEGLQIRHTLVSPPANGRFSIASLPMHMCLCVFKSCCGPFSFHASRPVCRFSFICIFGDLVIKITR